MSEPSAGPGRHEARERALELLFEADSRSVSAEALLAGLPLEPDPYAAAAVAGVDRLRVEIDPWIEEHAEGWAVARMPAVDRAILRLAAWELRERSDVPVAVVIDEAVELAKDYSTERSPSFVNGVLDSLARTARSAG